MRGDMVKSSSCQRFHQQLLRKPCLNSSWLSHPCHKAVKCLKPSTPCFLIHPFWAHVMHHTCYNRTTDAFNFKNSSSPKMKIINLQDVFHTVKLAVLQAVQNVHNVKNLLVGLKTKKTHS